MSPPGNRITRAAVRIAAAFGIAMAFALGAYLLLDATRPNGLISFSFLLILPAAICAFLAYVVDPWGTRTIGFYLLVPVALDILAIVVGAAVLREGVICILMLTPLWLLSGMAGTALTFSLRKRLRARAAARAGQVYCATALMLPLLGMQVEPMLPLPRTEASVTRSIVVRATPERLWPLLRGIPDVRPGEGRWNLTQDVIGVPRPLGASLQGSGLGAVRAARWGEHIRFTERIIGWAPGRSIRWRFSFDDMRGWDTTDRHLLPDTDLFRVIDGGYRVEPLGPGTVRLVLDTRYAIRTPVNGYARMWGELFLGDLENNLLALVKARAEAGASSPPAG